MFTMTQNGKTKTLATIPAIPVSNIDIESAQRIADLMASGKTLPQAIKSLKKKPKKAKASEPIPQAEDDNATLIRRKYLKAIVNGWRGVDELSDDDLVDAACVVPLKCKSMSEWARDAGYVK